MMRLWPSQRGFGRPGRSEGASSTWQGDLGLGEAVFNADFLVNQERLVRNGCANLTRSAWVSGPKASVSPASVWKPASSPGVSQCRRWGHSWRVFEFCRTWTAGGSSAPCIFRTPAAGCPRCLISFSTQPRGRPLPRPCTWAESRAHPSPSWAPIRSAGRQSHTGPSASCEGVDRAIWGLAEAEQRMWQLRFIDCSL